MEQMSLGQEEPHIYSVSEINSNIRQQLEGRFALLWIKGEISNFKAHSSGHFYFSLKDNKSQINAVMFRGFNSRLKFRPEDGAEVLVRGKITVYEPRGNYQIFCELMEPVGAGALQRAFEQLKSKLAQEGLFEASRKRALPPLPQHVAVVTSPTGAAIRDILHVLRRRFAGLRVTVVPALVQGETAPASIVKGLQLAAQLSDVDVIIVGRGGGSMEDLWAFNDEFVARAIVASSVPVISAVGHEVDFTIADFVADLRAPTPSAAAEVVVKNAADLLEQVSGLHKTLLRLMGHHFQLERQKLKALERHLVDPRRRLQDLVIRCDELRTRLEASVGRYFQNRHSALELASRRLGSPRDRIRLDQQRVERLSSYLRLHLQRLLELSSSRLATQAGLLDSLSPLRVVERGYCIVSSPQMPVVKDAGQLAKGDQVSIRFARGRAQAQVTEIDLDGRSDD